MAIAVTVAPAIRNLHFSDKECVSDIIHLLLPSTLITGFPHSRVKCKQTIHRLFQALDSYSNEYRTKYIQFFQCIFVGL